MQKPSESTTDCGALVVMAHPVAEPAAAPRWSAARLHRVLLAGVLTLGAAAHLRVWAVGRGLWTDELAIALNLRELSAGELFGPLLYRQVAPVGWLLGEDAVWHVFGPSERALRLPSLLASLAVLGLTALLAHRVIGRWGALAATALVASAPALLLYTGELKQYAVEAAVALLLLIAADQVGRDHVSDRARVMAVVGWTVIGTFAVFVSLSAVLVAAGALAGVGLYLVLRRRWRELAAFAVGTVPIAYVGGSLIVRRRSQPMLLNQDLVFPHGMPPRDSGPAQVWDWLPRMWAGVVDNPLNGRMPAVVIGLVLLGLAAMLAGQPRRGLMFAGVFAAALGAAVVRQFPLAGRVAVYLVAPVFIVIVYGLATMVRATFATVREQGGGGRRRRIAAVAAVPVVVLAAAAFAAGPAITAASEQVAHPLTRDRGREVLRDVARRLRPDDAVIFYRYSSQLGHYYGPITGVPHRWEGQLAPARPGVGCDPGDLGSALAGTRRVWWVHGTLIMAHPREYNNWVGEVLSRYGRVVDARAFGPNGVTKGMTTKQAGWTLVELGRVANVAPPTPPDERFRCFVVRPRQP